jgi:hypothetical protein
MGRQSHGNKPGGEAGQCPNPVIQEAQIDLTLSRPLRARRQLTGRAPIWRDKNGNWKSPFPHSTAGLMLWSMLNVLLEDAYPENTVLVHIGSGFVA